ncbi:Heme uptake protein MmpL11 [Streptomyces sp. enrichment culture]|uniref:MMPL family transporter n=1 Tax=Streptomyces sp. MD20-1-1 TaxID=3028668 RepID=UPI0029AB8392|nr:MMPL family transporter [Streptomyces sp. MD20-1-1]WTC15595.1 MMPL family transporter [Streptomyces cellulosae]
MPTTAPSAPPRAEGGKPARGPLTERLAGWSARNSKKTIGGWLLLVVLAVLIGSSAGSGAKTSDAGESGRAQRVIREQKADESYTENILIESAGRDAKFTGTAELEAAAKDLATALRGAEGAAQNVASPLDSPEAAEELVSEDGRSGLVTFTIPGPGKKADARFATLKAKVAEVRNDHPDVRIAMAGDLSLTSAINDAADEDLARAETLSLPVTLIILIVVFGALVAAAVPVLLAVTAVLAAMGVLGVVGTVIPANSTVSSVVLLIGMAVGVDYSLFYLRREREERAAGKLPREALRISARTSGHAVVVSGLTVMLSMAGLFLTGVDVFNGMAVGTILVVGLAVLGSVTVLPATLSLLGRRVDALRVPFFGRRRTTATNSPGWTATASAVVRRPVLLGGAALLALAALALPALNMKLSEPGQLNSLPRSIEEVDAGIRLQEAFPGGPAPAQVVVWGDGATEKADAAVAALRREAASSDLLGEPITVQTVGEVLSIKVPLVGNGTDDKSVESLEALREQALPAAFDGTEGLQYAVTGRTAGLHDFATVLDQRSVWVIAFVLAISLVLLIVAFRAPLVAVVSVLLNLLSIGAAYGVIVLGFQNGNLAELLGFTSFGGVVNWLPLFMFVILFGLSMDYHVFILSRIRERWQRGASARDAVVQGVGGSAGVVTSAAVVMIAVFALFATLSGIEYKMLGVGMATAIVIDATVVRGILLPAFLALLGDRAWGKRPASEAQNAQPSGPEPSEARETEPPTLTRNAT